MADPAVLVRPDGTKQPPMEALFWAIREAIGMRFDAPVRAEIIADAQVNGVVAELRKRGYEIRKVAS